MITVYCLEVRSQRRCHNEHSWEFCILFSDFSQTKGYLLFSNYSNNLPELISESLSVQLPTILGRYKGKILVCLEVFIIVYF